MVRILHTSDLQIGRIPSRLPEGIRASPALTWERIVSHAIEHAVDAVTLGGDIVDAENRFYEAYGPLEQGIRRLSQAGIPVVAVAGNHDVEVFPRLADALEQESFILLGRGGKWQRHTLTDGERALLHIDGWSFPTEKVYEDPVADYASSRPGDAPVVGLVHGDLDQSQSMYAPLSSSRLRQHDVAAWLLGHVHKPQAIRHDTGPLILYPGSPQGLDPGEAGLHGAWLLVFTGSGLAQAHMVPMASAIYEHHEVDLEGAATQDEVKKRIVQSTADHLDRITRQETGPLEHVVYRLHLTGRTPLHARLHETLAGVQEELVQGGLRLQRDRVGASVDKILTKTTPQLDLDRIAQTSGPPAALARTLIALHEDDPDDPLARRLLQEAATTLEQLRGSIHYLRLHDGATASDADPRRLLEEKGLLLLDALLAQKQDRQGGGA